MILLIDNYDSFVYNLARYVGQLGGQREVVRNDEVSLDQIGALNPSHIIISPGPCSPNEAGICVELIQRFGPAIPILGICLGHQAIGQAYGGQVVAALTPRHGKAIEIQHSQTGVFQGLQNPLTVGLYHSLAVSHELPEDLRVTATSREGEIMGLQHQHHPVHGVQFHPESVLTNQGYSLLENFLALGNPIQTTSVAVEDKAPV